MYRVSDYCNQFNILKFLEEHRKFKARKKELEEKLENISYLPSKSDDSGVRSGSISKIPERLALERLKIMNEISEIDILTGLYDYGFDRLSTREQDVIMLFYSKERSTPIKRTEYCQKYYTNETDLYSRDKPEAVDHFRRIIEEYFTTT